MICETLRRFQIGCPLRIAAAAITAVKPADKMTIGIHRATEEEPNEVGCQYEEGDPQRRFGPLIHVPHRRIRSEIAQRDMERSKEKPSPG